jgi:hypothetical protein
VLLSIGTLGLFGCARRRRKGPSEPTAKGG